MIDRAAVAVLAAYEAAEKNRLPSVDCYRAGLTLGATRIPTIPPHMPARKRSRSFSTPRPSCALMTE
jgi:hypothetical protein